MIWFFLFLCNAINRDVGNSDIHPHLPRRRYFRIGASFILEFTDSLSCITHRRYEEKIKKKKRLHATRDHILFSRTLASYPMISNYAFSLPQLTDFFIYTKLLRIEGFFFFYFVVYFYFFQNFTMWDVFEMRRIWSQTNLKRISELTTLIWHEG